MQLLSRCLLNPKPLRVLGFTPAVLLGMMALGELARAAGAVILGAFAPPAALLAFIDTGAEQHTEPSDLVKPQKDTTR